MAESSQVQESSSLWTRFVADNLFVQGAGNFIISSSLKGDLSYFDTIVSLKQEF